MAVVVVLAFVVPTAARFFTFEVPLGLLWPALAVGAAGAAAVEVVHRLSPSARQAHDVRD
jgi:cation-transporting ATPase E